jgi:hypothetical protein
MGFGWTESNWDIPATAFLASACTIFSVCANYHS